MPPKKDSAKTAKATAAPAGPPPLPAPPTGAFPPAQPPQAGQFPGLPPQPPSLGVPGAPPQLPQLPGLAPAAPPQAPPVPQGQFIPQPDLQQLQQAAQTVSMQDVMNQAQQLQQLPPAPMPQMAARPPQGQTYDAIADTLPQFMLRLDQLSNMIASGFAELTNLLAQHNQQRQQEKQDDIARGQALYDGVVATQHAILQLAAGGVQQSQAPPQAAAQPQAQSQTPVAAQQPPAQDPIQLLTSINANFTQQAELVPWLCQQAKTIAGAGRYSVDQFPDYIFSQQPAFQQYFSRDDLFKFLKVMGFDHNGVIQA